MYLMLLNYTSKIVKMINFMLFIFYHHFFISQAEGRKNVLDNLHSNLEFDVNESTVYFK